MIGLIKFHIVKWLWPAIGYRIEAILNPQILKIQAHYEDYTNRTDIRQQAMEEHNKRLAKFMDSITKAHEGKSSDEYFTEIIGCLKELTIAVKEK